ncbi:MAG TPA: tRNA (adenosine(37)-N6)-threonylcarbamoyltransferase complex transferase subunit TsaD [Candidatus Dormibacteraeota bacterium]|nr:tRNA (adenosine(37)-N6)-threonylcarbamoyltransferase complex transferase subunit TsaD [Candidatus Dormibacteraeota bacterium]
MNLLAVETSCDETAAAVLRDGRELLSSVVASQVDMHARFGGVVPELAARAHLDAIAPTVDEALQALPGGWEDLDAIAVTRGPGLIGSLLVGTAYAQSAALARGLPVVGVSHLAGHVYSAMLADPSLQPPYLALVVSGGHTDCVVLRDHGDAVRLAATRDDAVGEAFDKVARMLGLPYPGGPAVQAAAERGDPRRFPLPRTRLEDSFSFSGLKTAVRYAVRDLGPERLDAQGRPRDPQVVADLAAAFQRAAVDQLVTGLEQALERSDTDRIAVVGGVAANEPLREAVRQRFAGLRVVIPELRFCTDNAAMIAVAGWHRLEAAGADPPGFAVDPGLDAYS